jgi:sugar O-acyltransferase (sialic acid O-acetyltransferase NeuD family)
VTEITNEARVFVYGASGHGKVVADILQARGIRVEGFIDDDSSKPRTLLGLKVLGDGNWLVDQAADQPLIVALGIGDNFARRTVMNRYTTVNIRFFTAVHPTATVAASAKIYSGSVVMARAVINPDAVIGRGAIINTGAIVEHDCRIGDFAHLSPNVAVGGHAQVGDFSWLGIGSVLIHGAKVGSGSIIGAGAAVVRDIGDWVVAIGTPARVLRAIQPRTQGH